MDIIDVLTDIDDALVQWIIHATPASPTNTADVNDMKQVIALRGDLDGDINTIVLDRVRASTLDLSSQLADLDKVNDGLAAAAKTIATVSQVVSLATTAVGVAASIVAML